MPKNKNCSHTTILHLICYVWNRIVVALRRSFNIPCKHRTFFCLIRFQFHSGCVNASWMTVCMCQIDWHLRNVNELVWFNWIFEINANKSIFQANAPLLFGPLFDIDFRQSSRRARQKMNLFLAFRISAFYFSYFCKNSTCWRMRSVQVKFLILFVCQSASMCAWSKHVPTRFRMKYPEPWNRDTHLNG